ncbi:MAG: DUF4494 family protein [Tannerella sp.]|jgi:hypothetical protein|nr:DUF4494 family protein [Tannerella sp.]
MELIKKTVNAEEAEGLYLTRNESIIQTEDYADEETGEIRSGGVSEVLIKKGVLLTKMDISTLLENGIKTVRVSNIPILGIQEKYMNLWETILKVNEKGNRKKRSYIVMADSPAAAETFISEYFEVNVEAIFELVKVNQVEYNRVIKVYDTEREAYEKNGRQRVKWYKCQIRSSVEDEESGDEKETDSRNVLVQAFSFEEAIQAVKAVFGRDDFDRIYRQFKNVQELNIAEVFIPDEKVSYYSNEEL